MKRPHGMTGNVKTLILLVLLSLASIGCDVKSEETKKEEAKLEAKKAAFIATSMLNDAIKSKERWEDIAKNQRDSIGLKKDQLRRADNAGEIAVLSAELDEMMERMKGYDAELAELDARISRLNTGRLTESLRDRLASEGVDSP